MQLRRNIIYLGLLAFMLYKVLASYALPAIPLRRPHLHQFQVLLGTSPTWGRQKIVLVDSGQARLREPELNV